MGCIETLGQCGTYKVVVHITSGLHKLPRPGTQATCEPSADMDENLIGSAWSRRLYANAYTADPFWTDKNIYSPL